MELELARGRERANDMKEQLYFWVLQFCENRGDLAGLYAVAALGEIAAEFGEKSIGTLRTKDLLLRLALSLPGMPEAYDSKRRSPTTPKARS